MPVSLLENVAVRLATHPPPPDGFVGRDRILADLRARLVDAAPRARIGLWGLPGAGKSALASALGDDEAVRARFTDGVLWAGLGRHARPVGRVLRDWARRLAVERELLAEADDEELAQQLRSVLDGQRMLIMVDDAWSADLAASLLLGGPRCAHVVTTRQPEVARAIRGAHVVEIGDVEDVEERMRLVEQLAPEAVADDPEGIRELVSELGGLPLMLVVLGGLLRTEWVPDDPGRARDAMQRMWERGSRLEQELTLAEPGTLAGTGKTLLGIIDLSAEALGDDAAALHRLSIFRSKPSSFTGGDAERIAGVGIAALRRLQDAGLLSSAGRGRWTMHQTIAEYGAFRLAAEQADRLHSRAVYLYADDLRTFAPAASGRTSYERRFRSWDPEWADMSAEYHYHRSRLSDRGAARVELAREYFEEFDWYGSYCPSHFCAALLDAAPGDASEWLEHLRTFHTIYPTWSEHRGGGDWAAVADVLRVVRKELALENATASLGEHARAARATTDRLLALAVSRVDVRDREADRLYVDAYRLLRASGEDAWQLPWTLHDQGELYRLRGQPAAARRKAQRALVGALSQGDFELVSRCHTLLSNALWDTGQLQPAVDQRKLALYFAYRFQDLPEPSSPYLDLFHEEVTEATVRWLEQIRATKGREAADDAAIELHDLWADEFWPRWSARTSGGPPRADQLFPPLGADEDSRRRAAECLLALGTRLGLEEALGP